MYINHVVIENFRTFGETRVVFCHDDQDFDREQMPRPKLPNLNLLLGNNGLGKSTLQKLWH